MYYSKNNTNPRCDISKFHQTYSNMPAAPNKTKKMPSSAYRVILAVLLSVSILFLFPSCGSGNKPGKIPDNSSSKLKEAVTDATKSQEPASDAPGDAPKVYKKTFVASKSPAGYVYHIFENGTIEISSMDDNEDAKTVEIPAKIDDYLVTSIGDFSFYYYKLLESITIPESVTNIGECAFAFCKALPTITIPNAVTSIGKCAFENCESLKSITIPNQVRSIGGSAFSKCKALSSITIPDSVTSIGYRAFLDCPALVQAVVPKKLDFCGAEAFDPQVIINDSSGAKRPLYAEQDNYTYTLLNASHTGLVKYSGQEATITVPEKIAGLSVQYLEATFYENQSLASATIPASVTDISEDTFYKCPSLSSVTMPDSVASIGSSAFYECKALKSLTIPNAVTSIGEDAFAWCETITSVTIPASVTKLDSGVFSWCEALTSITIPNTVTSIDTSAFRQCKSLNEVIFLGTEDEWNKIEDVSLGPEAIGNIKDIKLVFKGK